MKQRTVAIERSTREVRVRGRLNLDGSGRGKIDTGIPFLDHMLELFAKHGLFDLQLTARGDLQVDRHHTNEDVGLALGEAFRKALADKRGIRRMGSAFVPMDETLARARVVADWSGRPHLSWGGVKPGRSVGATSTGYRMTDAKHFLEGFAAQGGLTLHVDLLKAGEDLHHILEAVFKALGRALREAVERDPRVKGIPSSKGRL
ncbi:MAG: imidazoleglycerol-phosphate dehydratase [Candidatus Omnitrophica bacterium CG11_big_fil_rev_8_21_14_0_20_64_10]|nr:MAG: imidazoleglycerol-phosphate dehydratase [Candidatus Omnitrophica bacterium CG11_big_fil_rev_8_21_14_0_20_64_10]